MGRGVLTPFGQILMIPHKGFYENFVRVTLWITIIYDFDPLCQVLTVQYDLNWEEKLRGRGWVGLGWVGLGWLVGQGSLMVMVNPKTGEWNIQPNQDQAGGINSIQAR